MLDPSRDSSLRRGAGDTGSAATTATSADATDARADDRPSARVVPLPRRGGPRVMVVAPNGFVRLALAHRLAPRVGDGAAVTLTRDGAGLDAGDYDVVVLGPFENGADRLRALSSAMAGGEAALIEIQDPPAHGGARLIHPGRASGAADDVMAALAASTDRLVTANA